MIDYLHVFSYSDRPGTPASEFPDKIDPRIIKERNAILTRISHTIREKCHKRQIGNTLEVISEHKMTSDGHYFGVSDNYIKVKLPGSIHPGKDIIKVKITGATPEYIEGDVIS